jgi:hypothetical protein
MCIESTYGGNPDYSGFYNEYGYFLLATAYLSPVKGGKRRV